MPYQAPEQIDVSKQLVRWIQQEHYGLLDVNLFPRPPSSNRDVSPTIDLISIPVRTVFPTVSAKVRGAICTRDHDISLGQLHFVSTLSR